MAKKNLTKIGDCIKINLCDNGFTVEANGRDEEGDWTNSKIICVELSDVQSLVRKYAEMERCD